MTTGKKAAKATTRFVDNDFAVGEFCIGRQDFYDFIDKQRYGNLSADRLVSQFKRQIQACGMDSEEVCDELLLDLSSLENIQMSAVKIFTSDKPEENPFYKNFNDATRAALQRNMSLSTYKFGFFFWLMEGIYDRRNLWKKKRLYRGTNCEFNFSLRNSVFSFNQFVSFSGHKIVALKFLSEFGTLFVIDGVYQMPLSRFSPYPNEDEHLIHPDQALRVKCVTMMEDLAVVQLEIKS